MDKLAKISKILVSLSVLIFSIAALIFALKFSTGNAYAVATARKGLTTRDTIYTQSADGKTLYQWLWNRKAKKWMKETYSGSYKCCD